MGRVAKTHRVSVQYSGVLSLGELREMVSETADWPASARVTATSYSDQREGSGGTLAVEYNGKTDDTTTGQDSR